MGNHLLLILDPALGTGTFLYSIIDHIRSGFIASGNAGRWPDYVRDDLIPRLFRFELLMAPYAVAHLKLGMQLAGMDLPPEQRPEWEVEPEARLGVYLTNSLEEGIKRSELLLGEFISEEANAAASIKRELPIMVVIGNPPYSGHSANRSWVLEPEVRTIRRLVRHAGRKARYVEARRTVLVRKKTFIGRLLDDYYEVDGKPLGERNPKWLQDDYVKFIRFAQWRVDRTGSGVVALITNHSYLDNPTFNGMRHQLLTSFDEVFLLDLHGSSRKLARGSEPDESVFDIKQGVAIALLVKHRKPNRDAGQRVWYAERRGTPKGQVRVAALELGGERGVGAYLAGRTCLPICSSRQSPPGRVPFRLVRRRGVSAQRRRNSDASRLPCDVAGAR